MVEEVDFATDNELENAFNRFMGYWKNG